MPSQPTLKGSFVSAGMSSVLAFACPASNSLEVVEDVDAVGGSAIFSEGESGSLAGEWSSVLAGCFSAIA